MPPAYRVSPEVASLVTMAGYSAQQRRSPAQDPELFTLFVTVQPEVVFPNATLSTIQDLAHTWQHVARRLPCALESPIEAHIQASSIEKLVVSGPLHSAYNFSQWLSKQAPVKWVWTQNF